MGHPQLWELTNVNDVGILHGADCVVFRLALRKLQVTKMQNGRQYTVYGTHFLLAKIKQQHLLLTIINNTCVIQRLCMMGKKIYLQLPFNRIYDGKYSFAYTIIFMTFTC